MIIKEGEFFEDMFFVKSGVISVELGVQYNNSRLILLRKRDHFGLTETLAKEKCYFNARVKTKTAEIFTLFKDDIYKLQLVTTRLERFIRKSLYLKSYNVNI